MSRPNLNKETDIYLLALCEGTGESMHGAIYRAVKFAYKHMISNSKLRHLEAVTKKRLENAGIVDRESCK